MVDVTDVRDKHRFDQERLAAYLADNLAGFAQGGGKLSVFQFR